MADEILKRDQNRVTVLAGISDDADEDILMLRIDPITKRLLISADFSGGAVTGIRADANPYITGNVTFLAGTGITLGQSGQEITINSSADLSVTLADVSANSDDATKSLYTMTSGVDVEFRTSGGNTLALFNEANRVARFNKISGDTSAGLLIEAFNSTDVALLGAGNTANATFYGAVNTANTITVTRSASNANVLDLVLINSSSTGNPSVSAQFQIGPTLNSMVELRAIQETSGAGSDGALAIYTRASDVLAEKFRIASTGATTINAGASTNPLTINRTGIGVLLKLESTNTADNIGFIEYRGNGSRKAFLGFGAAGLVNNNFSINNNTTNGGIILATNNTSRMTVEAGGDIGFGIENPTSPFHFQSNTTDAFLLSDGDGNLLKLNANYTGAGGSATDILSVFRSGVRDIRLQMINNGFRMWDNSASTYATLQVGAITTGTIASQQSVYGGATTYERFRYTAGNDYFQYYTDDGVAFRGGFGWAASSGDWQFRVNGSNSISAGTQALVLRSTGDVYTLNDLSIGVSSASARLHVVEATLGDAVQRLQSTATNDDPTETVYQNRVATTDATVTTIHTIAIPATTTVGVEAKVVARRTGGTAGTAEDGAFYIRSATFKNVAGTATQIGTTTDMTTNEDQSGWDVTFTTSGGNALLQVTGAVDNNITWHVTLRTYQVSS